MEKYVLPVANVFQYIAIGIQTEKIFAWIQLGLAILCSLVLLLYRIWKWYKEAKADGKITGDEIKQLVEENKDNVVEIVDKTVDLIDDIKDNSKK